jgi:hypothetical protein
VDDDRGETEPRHGRQPTWQQRVDGAGAGREPNGQDRQAAPCCSALPPRGVRIYTTRAPI